MLSEEKDKRNSSILMSSPDATLLFYPETSSCGDPVSAYSNISQ